MGPQALVVHADVTDYDQVTDMIQKTSETFGQIDILVNNAGITRDKTLKNMTKQHWDDVIHVNLAGLFNCTQQVLSFMLERKAGRKYRPIQLCHHQSGHYWLYQISRARASPVTVSR